MILLPKNFRNSNVGVLVATLSEYSFEFRGHFELIDELTSKPIIVDIVFMVI